MKYEWNSIVKSGVLDSLVNNYDALWGPYRMCCDLEEADGTIAAASLVKLGLKQDQAVEFCSVYNCVKAYLSQHPELSPGVAQLRALMAPLSATLPVAQRNDNLVELNAGQALGLALMCRLTGKRAIDQWLWRLDIELPLRAAVCALVPTFALTPLILAPADFIELCHDFALEHQPQTLDDFITKWQQLHSTELSSYQAATGLLAGQSWSFSQPRLVHIQTTMSYISNSIAHAQLINHNFKQHLELRQNTSELIPKGFPQGQELENLTETHWAQSIVTKLQADVPQGAHLLFSDARGYQITTNWIEPIVQAGGAFLLNIECQQKYSPFRQDSIGIHLEPVFTGPTALHYEHDKVKIKARPITDLPQLRSHFAQHFPHSCYVVRYDNPTHRNPSFFCTNLNCAETENFQQILIALNDLTRQRTNIGLKEEHNNKYFTCDSINWKNIMAQFRRLKLPVVVPDLSFLGTRSFDLAGDVSAIMKLISYLAQR